MSATAAVSVKLALRTALQALPGLEDVEVLYAFPRDPSTAGRERVFFGRTLIDLAPASLKAGKTFWDERGTVDIIVEAGIPGVQPEDTDARVAYLSSLVLDCIANNRNAGNDPTNGITGCEVTATDGGQLINGYIDNGSASSMVLAVKWRARLT